MTQELILIRGLPGSGKSTLAYRLKQFAIDRELLFTKTGQETPKYMDYQWLETDHFFCRKPDNEEEHKEAEEKDEQLHKYIYRFDPSRLSIAHEFTQKQAREWLALGRSLIVSNTFSRIWEMQPYLDMAKEVGAKVTVITCEGDHGNIHDVPQETIEKMRRRWEPYPVPNKCVNKVGDGPCTGCDCGS